MSASPTGYEVLVLGRGEEVAYIEQGRRYIFEVSFAQVPYRLYARQYWTDPLPNGPIPLPSDKRHIAQRVAEFLSRDGNPTETIWEEETYHTPLRSVDQILAEKLARRKGVK